MPLLLEAQNQAKPPQGPAKQEHGQANPLTAAGMPEFLAGYQKELDRVDTAYADLASENLPLLDENGRALGRHHIDDRRKELTALREIARPLAVKSQDLVLTTRLSIETEVLVDDLYDLSQIAYDNDREELGKRFADLEVAMDHEREVIETYALDLAASTQKRLEELEKENRDLELRVQKSKGGKKPEGKPRSVDWP